MTNQITSSTEKSSLLKIKQLLDDLFGKDAWIRWEPETIALESGSHLSVLLLDKLALLRIFSENPMQAFEDPLLLLHASEVINNEVADFDSVPHLTLLEIAYAVHSIKQVLENSGVTIQYPSALVKTVSYILRMEGVSVAMPPLDFIPQGELVEGQTKSDIEAKEKAVSTYIQYMDSL